jgi:hypothetical protein
MKDERLYAKFTLDFPDHPKILCLSTEAKWALVDLTIYSRRHMTDGFIPKAVALAKHGLDVCQELATNDAENPSLIESDSGFQIHDFALHQSTKAEIEELTEKRRRAGQKGGQARAKAHAKQVLKQNASKFKPETETETETKNKEQTSCSTELNPVEQASAVVQPAYPADFSAWWDVYPRRQSKRPAAAAFAKAKKRATVDQLIAGARRYAADPHRVAEFTKLPATWLNGDCWDDAPLPARGQSSRTQSQAGWDAIRHDFQPPHPQIGA